MITKSTFLGCLVAGVIGLSFTPAVAGVGQGQSLAGILDTQTPEIAILAPTEHLVLEAGTVFDYRWTVNELYPSTGPFDNMAFVLFEDLIYEANPFSPGEPEYVWSWTVPDTTVANCRLMVVVRDAYGNYLEEVSEHLTLLSSTTPVLPENPRVATTLLSPWPNPFNPSTRVAFTLRNDAQIDLQVFDVQGRQVRQLATGTWPAGQHSLSWDGLDDRERRVPGGLYLVRMQYHDGQNQGSLAQKVVMLP
jgi:hypothetical protein